MILVDFSSLMHQMIFAGVSMMHPHKNPETHKYKTDEFIGMVKYKILEELFFIQNKFRNEYKDMVLCLDDHSAKNWRKDILDSYKVSRKNFRQESDIDFGEVYAEIDGLVNQLNLNSPYRVIDVQGAEGDDVILSLVNRFGDSEKILIVSVDKDMLQAQRFKNVKQFNQISKKFMSVSDKNEKDINSWIIDHICLGDATDEIPCITHNIKFSQNFSDYLKRNNFDIDEYHFAKLSYFDKQKILKNYDIYNVNRKGEKTDLDLYKPARLGPSTLKKTIEKNNGLENWLKTNKLLAYNFGINKKLILASEIPAEIQNQCVEKFKNAEHKYKSDFRKYLENSKMGNILEILPENFSDHSEITVDDLLW